MDLWVTIMFTYRDSELASLTGADFPGCNGVTQHLRRFREWNSTTCTVSALHVKVEYLPYTHMPLQPGEKLGTY